MTDQSTQDEKVNEIINYLNKKTGKKFRYQNPDTITLIEEKINQGFDIDEFKKVIDIIFIIFKALSFENYTAQISLRDPENSEKYIGSPENWDKSEQAIIEACEEKGLNTVTELGEAAFYGPKLDFMVKDALGRKWQLGTIQVDYNLPERFELEYIGSDNQKHQPVMIHRAPFGSMERFTGILIEHFNGAFPLWLAPVQAIMIPIADRHISYAEQVAADLRAAGIRVAVDDSSERMNKKIRNAQLQKIPYMLVVGDKEAANGTIAVRTRENEDRGTTTLAEFKDQTVDLISTNSMEI